MKDAKENSFQGFFHFHAVVCVYMRKNFHFPLFFFVFVCWGVQKLMKIYQTKQPLIKGESCALLFVLGAEWQRESNYSLLIVSTQHPNSVVTWKSHRFYSLCTALEWSETIQWLRESKSYVEKIFHHLLDVLRTWWWKAPNIFQYSMQFSFRWCCECWKTWENLKFSSTRNRKCIKF